MTPEQRERKRLADKLRMRTVKARARGFLPQLCPPHDYVDPLKGKIHIVIGDTQVKEGVPTEHLTWIGQYCVDKYAGTDARIIHLGDHADMPSLSSYDKGRRSMEGRRYKTDVRASNNGFDKLNEPLQTYNDMREPEDQWHPEMDIFLGNHENRITVATELEPHLEGILSLDDLNYKDWGWTVHPFLKPAIIDGIAYAHYFYNPMTGKPIANKSIETRLEVIGRSFIQGHQQGLKYGLRTVGETRHQGLVLGTTYLHDERYLGWQGNSYWRGIVILHQVQDGTFDPMFVSLDFLCRRYTQMTLADFMAAKQAA
jgi:hypothetical protein